MRIFAMDTSGPVAGVALYEDGVLTHEIVASHGLTHSQTIMPMADDALSAAGIRLGNVFGLRYKRKAEFAGGVILILLGTKILLEHLGVL